MKQFQVSVSYNTYSTKPIDNELNEMIFIKKTVTVNEFSLLIMNGHSSCHVFNRNNFLSTFKSNNNFIEANFIVLDFDNSLLNLNYVLDNVIIKPSIAFETFSNTQNDFRFKLIYLLDNPVNDIQEYKRITEMVFNLAFNDSDRIIIKEALDPTCYRVSQMFHGTDNTKQIQTTDTVISIDLINQTIQDKSNDFKTYEEVFEYLNIQIDFKPYSKTKTKSKIKSKLQGFRKCPKKRKTRINLYNTTDFSCFPNNGTLKNDLFDMGINNEVYFIKSTFNNYHTIYIADEQYDNVYYFVGNQNIYAVNTYFVGGRQKKGYRKSTLQYTALVFRNLYSEINETEMFMKLKNYVIKFFEQPGDLDNDWIRRLAHSTVNMTEPNNAGKKYFVLNPYFNSLSKSDKMKELHKVQTEMMTYYVLNKFDLELSLKQNAELLHLSPKTVRKYMDKEGILFNNEKVNNNYQRFIEIYSVEANKKLSVRKLAEICEISKSQVQRYISGLNG